MLHRSRVSLKAGPRPLTLAFRLKQADDAVDVDVAPCSTHGDLFVTPSSKHRQAEYARTETRVSKGKQGCSRVTAC